MVFSPTLSSIAASLVSKHCLGKKMRFAVRRTRIARPRNEIRKEGGTTARRKVAGGKSCGEGAERGTHGDARTGRRWSLHPDDCRLHRHAFGLGLASVVRARALGRTHVPFAVSGSLFLRCIQFSCRKKGLYSSAATIITLHAANMAAVAWQRQLQRRAPPGSAPFFPVFAFSALSLIFRRGFPLSRPSSCLASMRAFQRCFFLSLSFLSPPPPSPPLPSRSFFRIFFSLLSFLLSRDSSYRFVLTNRVFASLVLERKEQSDEKLC